MLADRLQLTGVLPDRKSQLPSATREAIRFLDGTGRKIDSLRKKFSALEPNTQLDTAVESMDRMFGEKARHWFLTLHFGDSNAWVREDSLEDLPERAQIAIRKQFSSRVVNLWPFILYDRDNGLVNVTQKADRRNYADLTESFLDTYLGTSVQLGLFPYEPILDTIANQRLVHHRYRALAADLLFIKQMMTVPEEHWAAAPFLSYTARAIDIYSKANVPELQEHVLEKAHLSPQIVEALSTDGMWNNQEDLVAMCIDRGMREHFLKFYGLYRSVRIPNNTGSNGYLMGQSLSARNVGFRSILRVSV